MPQPTERADTLQDELFGMGAEPKDRAGRADRGPLIRWQPSALPASRRDLALSGAGVAAFGFVDAVVMWGTLIGQGSGGSAAQAVVLFFVAFGLGSLLAWQVRGALRPVGFGLMIGWAALTLLSAGFLTGVNP